LGRSFDDADGKTVESGLTISQADVRLAKNGADWAQKSESTTLVHEENGWYRCLLDTTDTDTVGVLMLAIHESGALPVWVEFHVLVANVYDSLFGAGTDKLDVNVEEWNATAVPSEHTAGYPIVTIKDGTGTGEIATTSGAVDGVLQVFEIVSNAISAMSFQASAITSTAIHSSAGNLIADHCRRRTQANVEASSDGDALSLGSEYGMIQQCQESNLVDNPGFQTVYKTDGTTELGQKAVTTDPSAEPVTGIE
jgi:hypothetical protein